MKAIYQINKWGIIITLFLYLTIYLGILSQVILGGIQVICFFILLTKWRNFPKKGRELLVLYGFLTATLIGISFWYPGSIVSCLWPISGVLAFFFLYICHQLKLQAENRNTKTEVNHLGFSEGELL